MKRKVLMGVLICYSLTLTQCVRNKNSVVTMNFDVVEPSISSMVDEEGEESAEVEGDKKPDGEGGSNNEIDDNRVVEGMDDHQFGFDIDSVVFLGDTRLQGLSTYNYVKQENLVISNDADANWGIEQIDTIKGSNPKMILVGIGLVDVLNTSKSKFKSNYKKLIKKLNEEFPDVTIGAMTIPLVSDEAMASNKKYENIEKFNDVIKDVNKGKPILHLDKILGKDDLSADGVSYHSKGYAIMIDKIKDIIK